MTISTTPGRQLDINSICMQALRLAGIASMSQGQTGTSWTMASSAGRDFLQLILDSTALYGVLSRAVSFYQLKLIAGQYRYNMPTSVLAVVGDGAFIPTDTADYDALTSPGTFVDATYVHVPTSGIEMSSSEVTVTRMDHEGWQSNSSKAASADPNMYYEHRELDALQVWFWPIPARTSVVRFQTQRILAAPDSGTATLDLERYWNMHVVYQLAAMFAEAASLSRAKVDGLYGQAQMWLVRARGSATQQDKGRIYLNHRSGWNAK